VIRTPPLEVPVMIYRLQGDPGDDVCCYATCEAPATCWVEGDSHAWTVRMVPLTPQGADRPQCFEFCQRHGELVAQNRQARTKPPKT